MKNIRVFLSENFQFLEVKFSKHLNRRVFVMEHVFESSGNSKENTNLGIVQKKNLILS